MPHKMHAPKEQRILHFTHIRHLPGILAEGALFSDSQVGHRLITEVGDRGIKGNRRMYVVTCGPGGNPCDYVPFYFTPLSPMLFKIGIGGVPHYQEGQDGLVYMVSTIGDVVDAGLPWVFSNGNCGSRFATYFDDLSLLDSEVDWDLQEAKWWNDTADDPNRATRRAVEFLVHQQFPWGLVRGLVVRNDTTERAVRDILDQAGSMLRIAVRSNWYYNGSKFR